MRKTTFSENQIQKMVREYKSGLDIDSICREYRISRATFYNWKKKYNNMNEKYLKQLKELQDENRRLKRMFADLSLNHHLLMEEANSKKY